MSDKREIVFDTETTGLDSTKNADRVIEIGAVEMIGGLRTGKVFHEHINPGRRRVHPDALAVHGLTDDFLRDKPLMRDIMPKFVDFVGDSPLIAHNARFDMGFMNMEAAMLAMPEFPNEVIDTLEYARKLFPMAKNSLDGLCSRFNIDKSGRTYHGALIDASLLADVYGEMMEVRRLDLGDSTAVRLAALMAKGRNIIATAVGSRPVRPVRASFVPSEDDIAAHSAFVEKKIKNSIWSNFG
jgi:DNA polymerase-3 subunit epsilon